MAIFCFLLFSAPSRVSFPINSDEKKLIQKQMAYILGRLKIFLELDEDADDAEDLGEIISNSHLNNNFLALAREVYLILDFKLRVRIDIHPSIY